MHSLDVLAEVRGHTNVRKQQEYPWFCSVRKVPLEDFQDEQELDEFMKDMHLRQLLGEVIFETNMQRNLHIRQKKVPAGRTLFCRVLSRCSLTTFHESRDCQQDACSQ